MPHTYKPGDRFRVIKCGTVYAATRETSSCVFTEVGPGPINEYLFLKDDVEPVPSRGLADRIVKDIWDAATNSVCQTMQDRDMCKCPDGDCIACKVDPAPEDYAYHAQGCVTASAPSLLLPLATTIQNTRQPIQPGRYGRVTVGRLSSRCKQIIYLQNGGMTADELREAAHLFNQIAEALEQRP